MKKIISTIMLLAAAATAFTSCDKQNAEATPSPEESVLVFTSEKPSFDDDVKTEWNETEKTVYWSKDDNIFMSYTVGGVWQDKDGSISVGEKAKFYASTKLSSSCKTAEFIVSDNFVGTTQGEHKFYGVYPNTCTNNDFAAPIATLNVASNQTLSSGSFYSSADIMIAESVGTYDSRPATAIPMIWNRIVAHTVITLADLKGSVDGEIVSSVTLTADTDAAMVGKFDVDITTRGFELNDGNTTANILTLSGGELTVEEGDVSFWACMMPCTWKSLTVVVDTDKATYTREIDLTGKEKIFLQNCRNLLTINMADATRDAKVAGYTYTVISKVADLTPGTYYMGGNNYDNFTDSSTMYIWKGTVNKTSNYLDTQDVLFTSNTFNGDMTSCSEVSLVSTGETNIYNIMVGSKYLYAAATALSLSDESFAWELINDDKDGIILSSTECNISINSSGATAIRAYASKKYKGIYFFKKN